ncbi:MAG: DUF975 family protein [Candidatus Eisenbacteria bacterium]
MSTDAAHVDPLSPRHLSPLETLGRGFDVLRADLGPGIGLGLFAIAFQFVGVIPWIGWLIALLATPAATAGCYRYALEAVRGEKPVFEVALSGFRHWWLATTTLGLSVAIPMLAAAPLLGVAGAMGVLKYMSMQAGHEDLGHPSLIPVLIASVVLCGPVALWLTYRLIFAPFVAMDEGGYGALAAVKRSWELTRGNWWRVFGLHLILGLIVIAGALVFGVGLIAALPVTYFALAHAYEQLRAQTDARSARRS